MKIIFFITHTTLSENHADMTLKSLSLSQDPMKFDRMYIYNTHPEELPNQTLLSLVRKYNLSRFIDGVRLFPRAYPSTKSLVSDVRCIAGYCRETYQMTDSVWLLKSDCVVSVNLVNEFAKVNSLTSYVVTPPFICAKARISDEEILEYCSRPLAVLSDDITFFNENETYTPNTDHRDRPNEKPTDEHIRFISCTAKRDFSSHYLTVDNLVQIQTVERDWGGCWFASLANKWIGTYRGFIVHKYHDIMSANRPRPREGTIEEYLLS